MNKKFSVVAMLVLLLIPQISFAAGLPADNIICIMSGVTVAKNGTSTYVIDLNSPQFGYRPSGDFSLQFKGFAYDASTGLTVTAAWRGCNTLPTSVSKTGLLPKTQVPTSKMASTAIVSGLNVASGNTEYAYGFFYIDTVRYVLVDITAGVTNIGVTAWVKVD